MTVPKVCQVDIHLWVKYVWGGKDVYLWEDRIRRGLLKAYLGLLLLLQENITYQRKLSSAWLIADTHYKNNYFNLLFAANTFNHSKNTNAEWKDFPFRYVENIFGADNNHFNVWNISNIKMWRS